MLSINRPFKIILNDYDFSQAGVIIIIALFCTACDSCTDCFHTLAMSIDDTSHDVRIQSVQKETQTLHNI